MQQLCPSLQRCTAMMDSGSARRLEEACQRALSKIRQ